MDRIGPHAPRTVARTSFHSYVPDEFVPPNTLLCSHDVLFIGCVHAKQHVLDLNHRLQKTWELCIDLSTSGDHFNALMMEEVPWGKQTFDLSRLIV